MPTKVTDDRPPSSSTATPRAPAGAGRGRPAPRPRSLPLFVEDHPGISRLYTVAMMADVLHVPRTVVRHWLRNGLLEPARRCGSVAWFEFPQLVVGRRLAHLLRSGLSLRDIDAQLERLAPGGAAEAARSAERIVADGRRLSILRAGNLMGAGGQLQLAFYTQGLADPAEVAEDQPPPVRAFVAPGHAPSSAGAEEICDEPTTTDLLDLAADLEANGALVEAAEALRALLQSRGPAAQVVFMLAELLYRMGDLTAARERYYAAIELDADHLEARCSLGCVLAELGEHELALAAFDGVLRQEPDFADAHWHIAGVLHGIGREAEARRHLVRFLALAPESPWATLARERLATREPYDPDRHHSLD